MGHHSPGQQCQGLNPSPHTQQVSVHHTHLHRNPTPTPSFLRRPQRARTGSPYRLLLPAAPLSAAPTPGCPGAMLALPGRPRATLSRAGRGAHSTAAHSSVPPALGAPLLRWHGRPLPAPAPQPPLRVQTELRPDGRSRGGAAARRAGRRAVPGAGGMGPPGEQRGAGAAGDLAALAELDEAALLGALRDRFLRQQIYVSAGAGRGAWGSALPSRLSPHRSPSPPPDRRGGHPHRREPLPAPAALRERGECRARAAPSGAREAAGSGAASPSPSSRAGPILQVSERYRCHEKGTLPPHIFAVADRAYQAMLGRRGARPQSQCIVIR